MINGVRPFKLNPPEPAESCGKCRFSLVDGPQLLCRRNPPQVTMVLAPAKMVGQMQPIALGAYPAVEDRQWCGEWRGKASVAMPARAKPGVDLEALRLKYPRHLESSSDSPILRVTAGDWGTVAKVDLTQVLSPDRAADEAYEALVREIAAASS